MKVSMGSYIRGKKTGTYFLGKPIKTKAKRRDAYHGTSSDQSCFGPENLVGIG
jgi:hypothetical protein